VVSDDPVERESSGAGLRLDDGRRSILAGEVAVDGICLEAIGQFCEELFRPLGVGVLAQRYPAQKACRREHESLRQVVVVPRNQSSGQSSLEHGFLRNGV